LHGPDRNAGGAIGRKSIDARGDRRERNRRDPVLGGKRKRSAVARGEQLIAFFLAFAAPHRPDRVNDVARRQTVTPGDLCVAGVAAVEGAAFREQLRSSRIVDRTVDAAAAEE